MLHNFKIKEFGPYREWTELSMFPRGDFGIRGDIEVDYDDSEILRNKIIFGPNDSGKTCLISAFKSLRNIILNVQPASVVHPYVNQNLVKPITEMEICFSTNGFLYVYQISISSHVGNIISEILINKTSDEIIFNRNNNKIEYIDTTESSCNKHLNIKYEDFQKQYEPADINKISLIKMFTNINTDIYTVVSWFRRCFIVKIPEITNILNLNGEKVTKFLKHFDTGISKFIIKDVTEKKNIDQIYSILQKHNISKIELMNQKNDITIPFTEDGKFYEIRMRDGVYRCIQYTLNHFGSEETFDLYEESEGILKLIEFSEIIYNDTDDTLFLIDEFDRKLHPNTVVELFKMFNEKSNKKQQLIITTHTTALMSNEYLRNDEVELIEKNTDGTSSLINLFDKTGINSPISEDEYLNGTYGGIPFKRRG